MTSPPRTRSPAFERFPRWMWRNDDVAASSSTGCARYNADLRRRAALRLLRPRSLLAARVDAGGAVVPRGQRSRGGEARARALRVLRSRRGDPQQYGLQAHLGIGPKCETEVVAQLVEMQRRKLARSRPLAAGRRVVPRRAAGACRAQRRGVLPHDVRRAHRVVEPARHAHGRHRRPARRAPRRTATPAKLVDLGAQLARRRCARDRDGRRRPDHARPAPAPAPSRRDRARRHHDPHRHGHRGPRLGRAGERERVRPSLPGSWEELFHASELPRFYATSAQLRRAVGEHVERLQRAIGVVYRPETERRSHYLHARLADEFDVDHSHRRDPRGSYRSIRSRRCPSRRRAATKFPETFPTGV